MNSLHLHFRTGSTCLRNTRRFKRSVSYGFTLVELLVVIVVLAVLASITLPLFRYTMTRINQSKQNVMLNRIKSALEEYRAAYGEYPITPNASLTNPDDVRRHYPNSLETDDAITMYSPFTNVAFNGATTVETCFSGAGAISIDYSLTYPLTIKQQEKGATPFMDFPKVTMFYMIYQSSDADKYEKTEQGTTEAGYLAGGGVGQVQTDSQFKRWIYGNPVNRYLAVDPISGYQWKYECTNGLNYRLSLNSF